MEWIVIIGINLAKNVFYAAWLRREVVIGSLLLRYQSRLDLSRICAAPSARLSQLPFKSDRAFPAQC